jgi:hypothetical protein
MISVDDLTDLIYCHLIKSLGDMHYRFVDAKVDYMLTKTLSLHDTAHEQVTLSKYRSFLMQLDDKLQNLEKRSIVELVVEGPHSRAPTNCFLTRNNDHLHYVWDVSIVFAE